MRDSCPEPSAAYEFTVEVPYGDANLDGRFDSADLVEIFQSGEYEDEVFGNSGWHEGDWNADGEFDSTDLILAFRNAEFEPNVAVADMARENMISTNLRTDRAVDFQQSKDERGK